MLTPDKTAIWFIYFSVDQNSKQLKAGLHEKYVNWKNMSASVFGDLKPYKINI